MERSVVQTNPPSIFYLLNPPSIFNKHQPNGQKAIRKMLINLFILVVASIVLAKSAAWLVHSLSVISRFFKVSEFTVSFLVVAIVTSLPEVWVGIGSALSGVPTLSLGNALGSNIADLTFITAIPVILSGQIMVRSLIGRRDALYMALFALTPLLLLWDKKIGRGDAILLLILYGVYLVNFLTSHRAKFFEQLPNHSRNETLKQLVKLTAGILLLLVAGEAIVVSSKNLALILNIPISLVGLFLVALGTSLPELAFGLKALEFHHQGLVMGNILGSVVTNSTLVLAVTALINPIVIRDFSLVFSSSIFLVITLALFLAGVYTDKKLSAKEGIILLFVYFFFLITEFGWQIVKLKRVF